MPSNIQPISPEIAVPKKEEQKEEISNNRISKQEKEQEIPPDVSNIVKKINEVLSKQWQQNEIRCGKSYIVGNEFNPAEIKEVIRIFSLSNWVINVSKERRGIIISFKLPIQAPEQSSKRGTKGKL